MNTRAEVGLAGALLVLAVTGLMLAMVAMPWVTGELVDRVDSAAISGLSEPQARTLAEEVRAYVTSSSAPGLRSTAFGRPAFDAAQVEHLDDVRGVMLGARVVTFVTTALVAIWLSWRILQRRHDLVSSAMRVAGIGLLAVVGLVLAAGLADFDTLFSRFHGVFFEPGTWQFAANDLVIQLFPEPFWIAVAGMWAALLVASGAVFLVVSWALVRENRPGRLEG
ncbi:MAG: lipoprotein intramolecular transacylase Lit [Coriobacteriia bacterium]